MTDNIPFTISIDDVEPIPGTAETLVRRRITHEALSVLDTETMPDGRAFLWVRHADEDAQDRAQFAYLLGQAYRAGAQR